MKKMYRKIAFLLMLSVSMCACGKKNNSDSVSESAASDNQAVSEASVSENNEPTFVLKDEPEAMAVNENYCISINGVKYSFTKDEGIENYESVSNGVIATKSGSSYELESLSDNEVSQADATLVLGFAFFSSVPSGTVDLEGYTYAAYKSFALQKDYEVDGLTVSSNVDDVTSAGYVINKEGTGYIMFSDNVDGNLDMAAIKADLDSAIKVSDLWNLEYGAEARLVICNTDQLKTYENLTIAQMKEEMTSLDVESMLIYKLAFAKELHKLVNYEIDSFTYKTMIISGNDSNFIFATIFGREAYANDWFDGRF